MFRISLLPFVFFTGHVIAAEAEFSAAELEQFTQSIEKKIAGRPEFQGTVVLMQGKHILWQYQRGTAAAGRVFDQNTAFFVGSISKILTSYAGDGAGASWCTGFAGAGERLFT